jgi:hypothetical protein
VHNPEQTHRLTVDAIAAVMPLSTLGWISLTPLSTTPAFTSNPAATWFNALLIRHAVFFLGHLFAIRLSRDALVRLSMTKRAHWFC